MRADHLAPRCACWHVVGQFRRSAAQAVMRSALRSAYTGPPYMSSSLDPYARVSYRHWHTSTVDVATHSYHAVAAMCLYTTSASFDLPRQSNYGVVCLVAGFSAQEGCHPGALTAALAALHRRLLAQPELQPGRCCDAVEVQCRPGVCWGGALHDLLCGGEPIRSVPTQDAMQNMLAGVPQHLPI